MPPIVVVVATIIVPVIWGWMVQWKVYVPAAANVRGIEVFALTPVMSLGGLAPVSNLTLWPTDPNTNVTTPPGATVILLGEKARDASALTVTAVGEGIITGGWVVPEPDEPHAASPTASEAEMMVESARCSIEVPRVIWR